MVANIMIPIKQLSVLSIEFIDTFSVIFTASLHVITNLSKSVFIQVQFFLYSLNLHSLLHLKENILGFQVEPSLHTQYFVDFFLH